MSSTLESGTPKLKNQDSSCSGFSLLMRPKNGSLFGNSPNAELPTEYTTAAKRATKITSDPASANGASL